MNITVCVKQVPDTADIKWNENNTINRQGVESIINPFDGYAVETALRIKDKTNDIITAVSMGPPQAQTALKEVIAMGVDNALLLSDKYFAGSDTASTSKTLAYAISSKLKDTDLIICGQCATDGDTAQTGPSLAKNLDMALVTCVKEIEEISDKYIIVKKEVEDGVERIKMKLPGVICMLKCDYEPRLPKISGRIKAQDAKIPVYTAQDIGAKAEEIGIKGSPTYVKKAFKPEDRVAGEIVENKSVSEFVELLTNKISEFTKG